MVLATDRPCPLFSAYPSELLHSMTRGSRGWVCSSLIKGEMLGNSLAGWGREPGRFPQILRRCCPSYLWGAVCHVSGTQGYREQTLCPTQTPSQRLGAKQGTYLGNKARQEDGRRDVCLGACGPITCIFSHLASGQIVQVLSF